jgi:hypothetical protein
MQPVPSAGEFSLWLMPPEPFFSRYRDLILRLSREYGTPSFPPHLTLLGSQRGEEAAMVEQASELARILSPVSIHLLEVGGRDEFFRCVIVYAEKSRELMEANRKARELFHAGSDTEYLPHLSLVYGYLDGSQKGVLIGRIEDPIEDRFEVHTLRLIATGGGLEGWRLVRDFPLTGMAKG